MTSGASYYTEHREAINRKRRALRRLQRILDAGWMPGRGAPQGPRYMPPVARPETYADDLEMRFG